MTILTNEQAALLASSLNGSTLNTADANLKWLRENDGSAPQFRFASDIKTAGSASADLLLYGSNILDPLIGDVDWLEYLNKTLLRRIPKDLPYAEAQYVVSEAADGFMAGRKAGYQNAMQDDRKDKK